MCRQLHPWQGFVLALAVDLGSVCIIGQLVQAGAVEAMLSEPVVVVVTFEADNIRRE